MHEQELCTKPDAEVRVMPSVEDTMTLPDPSVSV